MKPTLIWHHLPQFAEGYLAALPYQSVYARCLSAVHVRIRHLNLPGIDTAGIVVRKLPWAREFTQGTLPLPGIVITPEGQESAPAGHGTNLRDDIGYPVLVTLLAADNEQIAGAMELPLLWREQIARAFRQQRLLTVDEVIGCTVEPQTVIATEAYQRGVLQSAVLLRFISRERRK